MVILDHEDAYDAQEFVWSTLCDYADSVHRMSMQMSDKAKIMSLQVMMQLDEANDDDDDYADEENDDDHCNDDGDDDNGVSIGDGDGDDDDDDDDGSKSQILSMNAPLILESL
eukprot:s6549_g3.t1